MIILRTVRIEFHPGTRYLSPLRLGEGSAGVRDVHKSLPDVAASLPGPPFLPGSPLSLVQTP